MKIKIKKTQMKYIKYAAKALVFLVCLSAGMWIFAPWESAGRYFLDKVRLGAAKNGMFISYGNFEVRGHIFPTYTIKNLDIDQGMMKFTLEEVRVRILPLSSLLSRGGSCQITFQSGDVLFIPDNKLHLKEGGFKLSATPSSIVVTNVGINGDLEANGKLSVSRKDRLVEESTFMLRVPGAIDNILKNPVISGKILEYLEPVSDGEWRVKRNATPNS